MSPNSDGAREITPGVSPRFLYLHGLASSPASRKAQFFASCLRDMGVDVQILALDGGNFENLTVTAQLETVKNAAGDGPVILIGSSLGGYLAALFAAHHRQVERVILLAPAFRFVDLWKRRLGFANLERWRKEGSMPVFHYALGREVQLGYQIISDAETYEAEPVVAAPTLIFHGNEDDVVPVEFSVVYAGHHSNVELVRLEAGHELTEVLDPMWQRSKLFLQGVLPAF